MPHEDTPEDIWYHDTINNVGTMNAYITFAIHFIEEGDSTQALVVLQKAAAKYPAIKQNLYSEYLEKKRLAKA